MSNAKLPSVRTLQKLLSTHPDPELRKFAPVIPAGIRIVEYMFTACDAANAVKAPRGVKLAAVEVCNREGNSLAALQMECALWLKDCMIGGLGIEE